MADTVKQIGIKQQDGTYSMKDIEVDYSNVAGLSTQATSAKAVGDKNNKDITTYVASGSHNGDNLVLTDGAGNTSNVDLSMTGATSNANGVAGFVPQPTSADVDKFLKADGTWDVPPGEEYVGSSNISINSSTNAIDLTDTTVSSGTYGPSTDVTGTNGTTISVPNISVDAKGRITSITNKTYTSVDTGSKVFTGSLSEWDQLSTAEKKTYDFVSNEEIGGTQETFPANRVEYNNSVSSLTALDVQSAIDEIANATTVISWDDWNQLTPQQQESGNYIITDCPWADGDVSVDLMTKLWENPRPTSSFAAQNITLSSSDYDYLLIIGVNSVSSGTTVSTLIQKGKNGKITFSLSSAIYARTLNYSSATQYAVQEGYAGSTLNNEVNVPIVIYGIKTTASVKINAIAMDVSTSADKCMLSDGVTSVEDRLDAKTFGTSIALTDNTPITTTSDGYVSYSCGAASGNYCYLYINDVNVAHATSASNLSALPVSCLFVKKGMTIKFEGVNAYARFYPLS